MASLAPNDAELARRLEELHEQQRARQHPHTLDRTTAAGRAAVAMPMKPPRDLNADGKRAWERAVGHVECRESDVEALTDQIALYARAVDRSPRANAAWRKAGRPLTARNPNGAEGTHALLRAIEDADRATWRFGRALGLTVPGAARRPGRPTLADQRRRQINPMPPLPAQKLRQRTDPRLKLLQEDCRVS